ncbi:hypothetical protein [Flavobacterium sp.]|uniref:hypothetical protein n=1 Tax=Flavobacterium sp. TaxID=239 RepID=UPI00374D6E84
MKRLFAMSVIMLTFFISCKKDQVAEPVQIQSNAPKEAEIAVPAGDQCYASASNNIAISFNVNSHQEVNGKLTYNISGKDKNEGTLIGNMKGDTLIADYTFMSEGVTSVRQVAFLQNEGTYIEGYGDVVDANGKVSFKDNSKLKFDQTNTLLKVNCKAE